MNLLAELEQNNNWQKRFDKFLGHFRINHPEINFMVIDNYISFANPQEYDIFEKEYKGWK